MKRHKWDGQRKPPIHYDLFVALTGYSSTSCTSAELIWASPDKSSIHSKYDLSSNRCLRLLARLTYLTWRAMAMTFYQLLGIIRFHPTANNITSMSNVLKMFNP